MTAVCWRQLFGGSEQFSAAFNSLEFEGLSSSQSPNAVASPVLPGEAPRGKEPPQKETVTHPVVAPEKLIDVALPLDDINKAAAREKSIRHGHPSTLHLWWGPLGLALLCPDEIWQTLSAESLPAPSTGEQQVFVSRFLTRLPTEEQLRAWLAEERELLARRQASEGVEP